jgi:hypothetical protein
VKVLVAGDDTLDRKRKRVREIETLPCISKVLATKACLKEEGKERGKAPRTIRYRKYIFQLKKKFIYTKLT